MHSQALTALILIGITTTSDPCKRLVIAYQEILKEIFYLWKPFRPGQALIRNIDEVLSLVMHHHKYFSSGQIAKLIGFFE